MKVNINIINSITLFLYLISLTTFQRQEVAAEQYYQIISFAVFVLCSVFINDNRHINKLKISQMAKWYGLFILYACASVIWSKYNRFDVFFYLKAMLQIFCYLLVSPSFFERINRDTRINQFINIVLISLLFAVFLMVIRTPTIGTGYSADVLGINKNLFGTRMAVGVLLSLYMFSTSKKKKYIVLVGVLSAFSLLTGSKKAVIMLVMGICLFELIGYESKKISKLFARILIAIIFLASTWYLVFETDLFYNTLGQRLNRTFMYLLSGDATFDGSTSERLYYIDVARELFINNPILGVGMNNFSSYLYYIGYSHVAYSHNNYWELLSCLGIVGAFLYYWFLFKLLFNFIKIQYKKRDKLSIILIIILILYLVCDYGNVSYMNIFQFIIISSVYYCYKGKLKNSEMLLNKSIRNDTQE